ncbi:MAG: hypothetical protein GY711_35240 [bacterium]|nr:hypothetical protein [bacterium]
MTDSQRDEDLVPRYAVEPDALSDDERRAVEGSETDMQRADELRDVVAELGRLGERERVRIVEEARSFTGAPGENENEALVASLLAERSSSVPRRRSP